MGKALNFDTGLVEYDINGKVRLSFNPTDAALMSRMYEAFSALDKLQGEFERTDREAKDLIEFVIKMDAEMRGILDGLFGVEVSEPLFGEMNVFAYAGGAPVWANFMLALMDEMADSVKRESEASNTKLAAYMKKYRRK